ncbi:MAG TPA: 4-hydroxy-tetrahydrodipicolinate synthase [Coxiellaceae bacterium]|nr:4-hydroxy-tetrahydrodipicolinate synthase [Coxiellaceae bacterium]
MFLGSWVALVTPMQADDSIDEEALLGLIDWHLECGTQGIVIGGTTGESPTLMEKERNSLVATVIKHVDNRIPVIVGTGTFSTAQSIENTRQAYELGADACMVVVPYYNKPTQEGLKAHFQAIAEAVPVPLLLYNVPGRTACDLLPETAVEIANTHAQVIGVKEATGEVKRVAAYHSLGFRGGLFSGDDATAMEFMLAGGQGVISVTANIAPRLMRQLCDAALTGQEDQARKINQALVDLHRVLFVESNPIPVKWLLHHMGRIKAGIRLPLMPLSQKHHELLKTSWAKLEEHIYEMG